MILGIVMHHVWLIHNPGAGSAAGAADVEPALAAHDIEIVGRSVFPDDRIPTSDRLRAAAADTVIVFGGDGTINAAATALDGWEGVMLILPGGTMNMLVRQLHGDRNIAAIMQAAVERPRRVRLPLVEVGRHRAFVALIAGPTATWAHAREIARSGRYSVLGRAIRYAWARTFSRGVRVFDGARRAGRHQAVIVTPSSNGMDMAAIELRSWMDIGRIGWNWLTGDWRATPGIALSRASQIALVSSTPVHALFDGEEVRLWSPVHIARRTTRLAFLATAEDYR
jgi:diacylglycerol kinase family enzyme